MLGYRLKQARNLCRVTQSGLADGIGVSQPTIARIEQGLLQPNDQLLARIAVFTGFPPAFFTREDPVDFPEGSLVLYRRQAKLSSGDAAYIYQLAHTAFSLYTMMRSRVKEPSVTLPRLDHEDPVTAAQLTRSALQVEPGVPLQNLVRRAERAGVVCIALPCDKIAGFDAFAFSVLVGNRPVIALDTGKPTDRLRFTVGHELAHLVMHQIVRDSTEESQKEAHSFAAELLLPEAAIRDELIPPLTLSQLFDLKLRWGVSMQALLARAHELGIITDNQHRYLMMAISKKGWRKQEPGSDQLAPERPRLLRQMTERVYSGDLTRLAADASIPIQLAFSLLSVCAGDAPLVFEGQNLVQFPRRGGQA